MSFDPKAAAFNGPEEFVELCDYISWRLHSANRIAMGESKLAREVANLFPRLGRLLIDTDDDLWSAFGDGYTPARLTEQERRQILIELLFPE